jgi:hypothetical protein
VSWNYRILKHIDYINRGLKKDKIIHYGLHEVYYDSDNKPHRCTKHPIDFGGFSSPEDLISQLELALRDCRKHSVLDYKFIDKT